MRSITRVTFPMILTHP